MNLKDCLRLLKFPKDSIFVLIIMFFVFYAFVLLTEIVVITIVVAFLNIDKPTADFVLCFPAIISFVLTFITVVCYNYTESINEQQNMQYRRINFNNDYNERIIFADEKM